MLRHLILGLLRDGAPRHGYALMKEYRERAGFQISVGNFYRELQRLLSAGWVRATENPTGADPRRAPYQITAAGATAFDDWVASSSVDMAGEQHDDLAMRAFLIVKSGGNRAVDVLDQWQEELAMRRRLMERAREAAATRGAGDGGSFAALQLLLARRLRQVSADLEFVEEVRSAYRVWLEEAAPRGVRTDSPGTPGRLPPRRRGPARGPSVGTTAGAGAM